MSKTVRSRLGIVRRKLRRRLFGLLPDAQLTPMHRFYRDGADALRTDDLDLDQDSVVLDFGGFVGDYAATLRSQYGCQVHVFEPVPQFASALVDRFAQDEAVVVHAYAVGLADGMLELQVEGDASSAFLTGPSVTARVVAVSRVSQELPSQVALAKINIEGGEFELLPAMHEAGLMTRVNRFIIQFHPVDGSAADAREKCQRLLAESHTCDWDYPWVWESWTRKSDHGSRR